METVSSWYLIIALFCVFLNAFFVAAEFAMVKVRLTRLEALQAEGSLFSRWASHIVQNLNNYLSATQLGVTLASLGLGWLGEPAFAKLLGPIFGVFNLSARAVEGVSFAVAFAVITILHLILGELLPKRMAIQTAEKVLKVVAVPLRIFTGCSTFLFWLLHSFNNQSSRKWVLRRVIANWCITKMKCLHRRDSYERDPCLQEGLAVRNVFEFTHRMARHIMVPRRDIVYLLLSNTAKPICRSKRVGSPVSALRRRFRSRHRPREHQRHYLGIGRQRQSHQSLRYEATDSFRPRRKAHRSAFA